MTFHRWAIWIILFCAGIAPAFAQGVSRSTGLGLRLSFWNMDDQLTRLNVTTTPDSVSVEVGGIGTWLYFSSRVHNNIFLDMNLGAIARIQTANSGRDVDVSAIVPFLFGVRYDILSVRFPSSLQPYLSLGGGPYWATSIAVRQNTNESNVVAGATKMQMGYYYGGGMNLVLMSWLGLNFDVKYHTLAFRDGPDFSGFEFGLGMNLMWGRRREIVQFRGIRLVTSEIYPAYYQFYSTYPLALVSVKNLAGRDIEVNIRSRIRGLSSRRKDSGFTQIRKGETRDLPVTAFFDAKLLRVAERQPAILDVEIEARAGGTYRKEYSAPLVIQPRNAWDGDMDRLRFFLTPDAPEVLRLSRRIVSESRRSDGAEAAGTLPLARRLFEALRERGLHYLRDPNIPFYEDDRVQFAAETLDIGSGDCDDLVVLYASLLESVGIPTAFIEVRDPDKEIAHLYLLFDSDLTAAQAALISTNEKRYVIRPTAGRDAVWVPVEATLIDRGFEAAWEAGALQYLQEGLLRSGLAAGWVRVIDFHAN